jgi:hypothetical protein
VLQRFLAAVGGLDRLVEQIDHQLGKSGVQRVEAVH